MDASSSYKPARCVTIASTAQFRWGLRNLKSGCGAYNVGDGDTLGLVRLVSVNHLPQTIRFNHLCALGFIAFATDGEPFTVETLDLSAGEGDDGGIVTPVRSGHGNHFR